MIPCRVVNTFVPLQHPDGGFGGGQGQYSHLATSYAAVLSIVLVGGEETYRMIDRKGM
jgi:protein farnesyltransferase subunit beta